MTPTQWRQVEELFHRALDLRAGERSRFLEEVCGTDVEVRGEIETLLDADGPDLSLTLTLPLARGGAICSGARVNQYEILDLLGQGGMGTVYRARHVESGEIVAIKFLSALASPELSRRHLKEVRATSSLHHPYLVSVHDVSSFSGREYLVMEYVAGPTLARSIPARGLPILEVLRLASMMAEGLAAVHAAGVIHRDLKPANVIVTESGSIKILDFGLAKLAPGGENSTLTTATGQILGTAAYLSPEQAEGKPVDARTDLFSFGAVLYEMLTGVRPFERDSLAATLTAILRDQPPAANKVRPDIPAALVRIVDRCLEKDRELRYRSAAELRHDLEACRRRLTAPRSLAWRLLRRKSISLPAFVLLFACVIAIGFWGWRQYRIRWARQTAEPQVASLLSRRLYSAADALVDRIVPWVPQDQVVREFQHDYRMVSSVSATPAGAEIAIKDYNTPDAPWRVIGRAPLQRHRFPIGYLRWRVSARGYRTREFAETVVLQPKIQFELQAESASPAGMVRVPEGLTRQTRPVRVPAFWLDRFEVTNRQFEEFVKAGGYRRPEFWQEPFQQDGRPLAWKEAMALFSDQTGMPGPAGWQLGAYPEGQAEYPVTGVSWYEAAAYARFADKSLPTYFHFQRAARTELLYADTVLLANFSNKAPAPVGAYHDLDRYGTYDLAGNAKEWVWNESGHQRRYTLGGSWKEAIYAAALSDSAPPWERRADIGFRCARYDSPPPPELLGAPANHPIRDYTQEQPVGDAEFARIRQLYDYQPAPLGANIEASDESSPYWRRLKVSYEAAYEHQRVTAYLFLPRTARPPYQTVVYWPSGISFSEPDSSHLEMWWIDPLIRTGRAVLYPVLWDTYERRAERSGNGAERWRLLLERSTLDLRRSLDYLDSRGDIDHAGYALFAFSSGSTTAPVPLAVDPRWKVALLAVGGLAQARHTPETDPFNFVPRVHVPVLMLNGRYDGIYVFETSQRPFLQLLGTPAADKKMLLLEAGHAMVGYPETTKESLAWLDRYLGPIIP